MRDRALDRLFRRFRDEGDGTALAAVFDATARELLGVSCHLVRDPAEAEDLVQTTFLTAIRKADRFVEGQHLRGWLYGILWREAAKARRRAARRVDPDRLSVSPEPQPLERLLAKEVPSVVAEALDRIPPHYREVLEPLIREGRSPEEIARELERAPGTVRTQIHRGMERLRRALPPGFSPAGGWVGSAVRGLPEVRADVLRAAGHPCTSVVSVGGSTFLANAVLWGVVVQKKILIGAFFGTLALGSWLAWNPSKARVDEPLHRETEADPFVLAVPPAHELPTRGVVEVEATEASIPREAVSEHGSLIVRVMCAGAPLAEIPARVWIQGVQDAALREIEVTTNDAGRFQLDSLPPGEVRITPAIADSQTVSVKAGEEATLAFDVQGGLSVDGVVVDPDGFPVAGAEVWSSGILASRTDEEGEFRIGCIAGGKRLNARADGFAPSQAYQLSDSLGPGTARLDLKLVGLGGGVTGVVRNAAGQPIEGAVVRIGNVPGRGYRGDGDYLVHGAPPLDIRTDVQGSFAARGVPEGTNRILARAPDYSAWEGSVTIARGEPTFIDVTLERGAIIEGFVHDEERRPISGASISVEPYGSLASPRAFSAVDGSYRLTGVSPEKVGVSVYAAGHGSMRDELRAEPNERIRWDPVISPGPVIRGRLLDPTGASLENWMVVLGMPDSNAHWLTQAWTDTDGRFRLAQCPEGPSRLDVRSPFKIFLPPVFSVEDVYPDGEELVIRIPDARMPTAYVEGRVSSEDDTAVAGASIHLRKLDYRFSYDYPPDPKTGTFRLGPLEPGRYAITAKALGHAPTDLGQHELGANATLNLGDIRLSKGGYLVVTFERPDGTPLERSPLCGVYDGSDNRVAGANESGKGGHRLGPLREGTYLLRTSRGPDPSIEQLVFVRSEEDNPISVVVPHERQ